MSVIDLEQSIKSHASFPGKTGNIQCAGGNPAGLRRCWCQSLHEYKAEISSQLWKQALRAICPCQCFWGSLMSQISVCDLLPATPSPLCVTISTHTKAASLLQGIVLRAALHNQKGSDNIKDLHDTLFIDHCCHWHQPKKNGKPAGIVSKQEWFRAAFLSPQKLLWAKSNFGTSQPSRKNKPAFLWATLN